MTIADPSQRLGARAVDAPAAAPIVTATAVFGIDALSEAQVVDMILSRSGVLSSDGPHLIVTPNMNHLALLEHSEALGAAYRRATLHLADGWPVVCLARALGENVADRTTGSGILDALAEVDGIGRRIFIVGGSSDDASRRAAARFRSAGWDVRSHQAPPEFVASREAASVLSEEIRGHQSDVVVIGIGAVKQEVLATGLMSAAGVKTVYLGVGAAIDFLAGEVARAPRWMRRLHLEFLHRILTDPARLAKRYIGDVGDYLRVARRSIAAAGLRG
ncbi:WecB/TagA/CpsF family glycosyltransferase [Microbacterium schleiferi]|uniref:WecB/TagA/CpsF family glycosyltransferase n=1 Tax=Microbacterium schleiferi TaxID=69362 RepID=UPI0035C8761B